MLVTEEGMDTTVRAEQTVKAEIPIVVRAFPKKVTDSKLAQRSNARSAILVTVLGIVIDCKRRQL